MKRETTEAGKLTEAVVRLIKTCGAETVLGSRPEAEIRRYLAHLARWDCLSWCGDAVQAFGLLTVWPVAHDFLVWCPEEPVVGHHPDWDADTLYIGELILTGPPLERGRQLAAMVQCLAAKHPEGLRKPWRAHRGGQLVNMDRWKTKV